MGGAGVSRAQSAQSEPPLATPLPVALAAPDEDPGTAVGSGTAGDSEFDRAIRQHTACYVRLVEKLGGFLRGDAAGKGKGQLEALQWLRQEQGNLLLAFERALQKKSASELKVLGHGLRIYLDMVSEFRSLNDIGDRLRSAACSSNWPELELHGLLATMQAKQDMNDYSGFDELAARAELLAGDYPELLGAVYRVTGSSFAHRGQKLAAETYFHRSIALAAEQEDRAALAATFNKLGSFYYDQGNAARASQPLAEAARLSAELGNLFTASMCNNNLALVEIEHGNLDRAKSLLSDCFQLKMLLGDRRGAAGCLANLANLKLECDELEPAIELNQRAVELMREVGYRFGTATVLTNLGNVERRRGEFDRAEQCINEALLIYEETPNAGIRSIVLRYMVLTLLQSGRVQDAAAILASLLKQEGFCGNPSESGICLGLAGLLLRHVDLARSLQLLQFASRWEAGNDLNYGNELRKLFHLTPAELTASYNTLTPILDPANARKLAIESLERFYLGSFTA